MGDRAAPDAESAAWLADLHAQNSNHDDAVKRLHELLVRVAHAETQRRGYTLGLSGPELDDLAQQAADDALVAILRKLDHFRGESRFTTWALRFVILEAANKISRHHWRHRELSLDVGDWDRLPDAFGFDPTREAEWADLIGALRRGIEETLTTHQRRIFHAVVIEQVPLDVLVDRLETNRNAIYKTVFDARRKLRAFLVANGYLDSYASRQS